MSHFCDLRLRTTYCSDSELPILALTSDSELPICFEFSTGLQLLSDGKFLVKIAYLDVGELLTCACLLFAWATSPVKRKSGVITNFASNSLLRFLVSSVFSVL